MPIYKNVLDGLAVKNLKLVRLTWVADYIETFPG